MVKVFDKNMFIMFIAISAGVVLVTYFIADINNKSAIDNLNSEHIIIIDTMSEKNDNFTNNFLESSVLLDMAREDRASGNYHFDLAKLFYISSLSENDISLMESYKSRTIENCTVAIPNYLNSYMNFKNAQEYFKETKTYVEKDKYINLIDNYISLTESGAKLAMMRTNSSKYLKYLAQNLTMENDTVVFMENVTLMLGMFDLIESAIIEEIELYEEIKEEIDEYGYYRIE